MVVNTVQSCWNTLKHGVLYNDIDQQWRSYLGLRPANERRRYKVPPSLIGWVQA